MSSRRLQAVGAVMILLTACSPESTGPTEASSPTTTADTMTSESADVIERLEITDQLAWFLGVLNGETFDEDEYQSRFVAEFFEQVSYDDFTELSGQIAAEGSGWSVMSTETQGSDNAIVLVSPTAGAPVLRVLINIDSDGIIDGLFIQPGEPPSLDSPPDTYAEAFDRLAALGTTTVLVAETTNGSCNPIASVNPATSLPIGSMFKLYVLGALTDQVADGTVSLEDRIVLEERLYSHPSGTTQNEDPGSTLSVRELAERMISISDNTATDHLIALVGRSAVEAVQADMGHSSPELNVPFLTTRELFQLKLGDPAALATYVGADQPARRALLGGLADESLPPISPDSFVDPIEPLDVEWFAAPTDLCAAWVSLAERASEPDLEVIRSILTANPGIPDESGTWDEIWFKGGSEPGVLGLSWYLTVGDRSFVVAGMVANVDEAFDQTEASLLLGAVRDLLASEASE